MSHRNVVVFFYLYFLGATVLATEVVAVSRHNFACSEEHIEIVKKFYSEVAVDDPDYFPPDRTSCILKRVENIKNDGQLMLLLVLNNQRVLMGYLASENTSLEMIELRDMAYQNNAEKESIMTAMIDLCKFIKDNYESSGVCWNVGGELEYCEWVLKKLGFSQHDGNLYVLRWDHWQCGS